MLRKVDYSDLYEVYQQHTIKSTYKEYQILSFHSSTDTFLECLYKGERKLYILNYEVPTLNDIYFIGECGEKVMLKDFERAETFPKVFVVTKYNDTLILHDNECCASFNEYVPAGTLFEIDTLCFDNEEILDCNCENDRIAFWTQDVNLYVEE